MQQRSGSATSSPHTCPPHARSRSDGASLHSLQLVTPSSSDRERPTTPSSSASSEQARLHGSNAGSHQGTARVLCLTPGMKGLSGHELSLACPEHARLHGSSPGSAQGSDPGNAKGYRPAAAPHLR